MGFDWNFVANKDPGNQQLISACNQIEDIFTYVRLISKTERSESKWSNCVCKIDLIADSICIVFKFEPEKMKSNRSDKVLAIIKIWNGSNANKRS